MTGDTPITLSEHYAELVRRVGEEGAHALVALYNLQVLQDQASPFIPVDPFTLEFADQQRALLHLGALLNALDQAELEELAAAAPADLAAKKLDHRARKN